MGLGSVDGILVFDPTSSDLDENDNIGAYIRGKSGNVITSTTDGARECLNVSICNIDEALNVDVDLDGIYEVTNNPDPDNVGIIAHTRSGSPGDLEQVERTTADKPGEDAIDPTTVKGLDVNSFMHSYDSNDDQWNRFVALSDDDSDNSSSSLKMGSRAFDGALTAVSATGDRADMLSDMYRRVYVNNGANIDILSSAPALVKSLAAVKSVAAPLAGRRHILIQNLSTRPIYVGDSAVSVSTGTFVGKHKHFEADYGENIDLWILGTDASDQDVRVLESA